VARVGEGSCYPVCLKELFQSGEIALFYNVQPKYTLALKEEKFQEEKGYEDRVTVILIWSVGSSEKVWGIIHVILNHGGLEDCF
jgi:hypothetical protein